MLQIWMHYLVPDASPFWNIFSQPRWGYAGEIQNTPNMKWNMESEYGKHSSAIY